MSLSLALLLLFEVDLGFVLGNESLGCLSLLLGRLLLLFLLLFLLVLCLLFPLLDNLLSLLVLFG